MKNSFISLLLIGSIVPSFAAHGMLKALIKRIKPTLPIKTSQQIIRTPDEYYDYEIYHAPWNMNEWLYKKNAIILEIQKAHNNTELIKNIVNSPEGKGKGRHIGQTPLCRAAEMNDFEFTTFLLQKGARVNDEVRGVHGNDPHKFSTQALFFARTYEMVQLLQNNGADIHSIDGLSATNILHTIAQGYGTRDIRIFDYAISQGVNPESHRPYDNGNIWHSLLENIYSRPEKQLLDLTERLHDLAINPYHENTSGKSAVDIVQEHIESSIKFMGTTSPFKLKNENAKKANDTTKFMQLYDHMKTIKTMKFKEITTE